VGHCPACGTAGTVERPYVPVEGHQLFRDRRVAVCRTCALRYCDPMPTPEDVRRYYDRGEYDAGSRSEVSESGPWSMATLRATAQFDLVSDVLGRTPDSWLDIGAGYGLLLDEARRRGVGRTGGIEPTPIRFRALLERGHTAWRGVGEASPGWAIVSFSHVLEHVVEPRSFLQAAAALLQPGGLIFCEVPNVQPRRPDPDEPHLLFFTSGALARLFEVGGFRVRTIREAGRRTGRGWDRLTRYLNAAKEKDLLPAALNRFDPVHHYGDGQGRIYLRCIATPL